MKVRINLKKMEIRVIANGDGAKALNNGKFLWSATAPTDDRKWLQIYIFLTICTIVWNICNMLICGIST